MRMTSLVFIVTESAEEKGKEVKGTKRSLPVSQRSGSPSTGPLFLKALKAWKAWKELWWLWWLGVAVRGGVAPLEHRTYTLLLWDAPTCQLPPEIMFFRGMWSAFVHLCHVVWTFLTHMYADYKSEESESHALRKQLEEAKTLDEWHRTALELDVKDGLDYWKGLRDSDEYDRQIIEDSLQDLRKLQDMYSFQGARSFSEITYSLRQGVHRNVGGIGNPRLYEHTRVGTKYLIEEYLEELDKALCFIANAEHPAICLDTRLEFFEDMRRAYGRSALLLSGGASLAMYHLGVVKVLFEQDLLPRVVSGSSGGAIVAAMLCTKCDSEIGDIFREGTLRIDAFQSLSAGKALIRLVREGFLMDVKVLERFLKQNLGEITFDEAFQVTKRVLNVTVTGTKRHHAPQLLNYLTAPNVYVWSATAASCACPMLFDSVELLGKDANGDTTKISAPGLKWMDGSVESDLPIAKLSELFNVNHFIVSQVNPHVVPFVTNPRLDSFWARVRYFVTSELKHRALQLIRLGWAPRALEFFEPVFLQQYSGDITIVPPLTLKDYGQVIKNPTQEDILRGIWIEHTLARLTRQLKAQIQDLYTQ